MPSNDEIVIIIPDTNDNITVDVSPAEESVDVETEETTDTISTDLVGDKYYCDLAKDWAIKTDGMVLGQDYSSKYYAQLVGQNTEEAQIWAEGTDEQVAALGGTHSSKGWVNYVLTNPPTASVEQTETGATITVTDINGTTTAEILNGQNGADGADGADGQDGVSPTATVTQTASGATITITDANGTTTADIANGTDGQNGADGQDGQDGFSPTATVTKSGSTATISITDKNGTTTTTISDGTNGTDGQDGADGFSPIATVTKSGDTATITITDINGTTTATISDGTGSTVDQTYDGTSANAQSGVAIQGELSTNYQSKLTFSTGLTNTSGTITVTDYNKILKNEAGTVGSMSIGVGSGYDYTVNVGYDTGLYGNYATVIGYGAEATTGAIQLGYGTNSTANSLSIGFYNNSTTHYNWQLLDGTTGLIPDARISSNIARTSAIPTVPTNISSFTNDSGYITGINSSDVTTALGYTPYSSSNPDGYITSSALTNYVTTNTAQDISGKKTFLGEKAIYFKQSATTNKLGFTLYNPSNTELGAFEYRPNTISSNALLNINTSYSNACYVGFRYWGTAVNVIAPKPSTAGDYYIPINITDGNTTVTAANTGTVNISSLLPTVPTVNNATITFTQGGTTKGTITLNQANNDTIALDAGGGGGASNLTDLGDVSITSASSGEVLTYDGNDWINSPKTLVTIRVWS